jgi:hypothetical protein
MKKTIAALLTAVLLTFGAARASAQSASADTAPKSVIHVVTVSWKSGTTDEQIQAALDGAKAIPAKFKGVTRVWTKTLKHQGERTHAIVMEFRDADALKEYSGSDAQKEWYKVYTNIRDRSTTFDVTN